jgi:hypothetical protein
MWPGSSPSAAVNGAAGMIIAALLIAELYAGQDLLVPLGGPASFSRTFPRGGKMASTRGRCMRWVLLNSRNSLPNRAGKFFRKTGNDLDGTGNARQGAAKLVHSPLPDIMSIIADAMRS